MKAFVQGLVHHHPGLFTDQRGRLVDNYLDDIWFLADTYEKNMLQLMVAEYWASWLGIQLNFEKRELPSSRARHLGFNVDLARKVVLITEKHTRKILSFFDQFLAAVRRKQSISLKRIQKMLGLQIWISTAFRIARLFLTTICDIVRVSGCSGYFRPRNFML